MKNKRKYLTNYNSIKGEKRNFGVIINKIIGSGYYKIFNRNCKNIIN